MDSGGNMGGGGKRNSFSVSALKKKLTTRGRKSLRPISLNGTINIHVSGRRSDTEIQEAYARQGRKLQSVTKLLTH